MKESIHLYNGNRNWPTPSIENECTEREAMSSNKRLLLVRKAPRILIALMIYSFTRVVTVPLKMELSF